jgi:hypothetical protein
VRIPLFANRGGVIHSAVIAAIEIGYGSAMRLRRVTGLALVGLLMLTGCATANPAAAPEPGDTTAASASPIPTPTPTPAAQLILTVDAVIREVGDTQDAYPLTDAEAVLALMEELTGQPRAGTPVEGPYGSELGTRYDWEGVSVLVNDASGRASLTVDAASIGDLPVATAGGLAVGSSRDAVVAAGAWDDWDEDQDGVADWMGVDAVEVPGTTSLSRDGAVGIEYITLHVSGDTVVELQVAGNDFSDI